MPVQCLSEAAKSVICGAYTNQRAKVSDLAYRWDTSPRTIRRILEERGLASPVPRLKGDAYQVMKLLQEFGIPADKLRSVLEQHQKAYAPVLAQANQANNKIPALFRAKEPVTQYESRPV